MSEKEKNRRNNQKKCNLQVRLIDCWVYAYNHYAVQIIKIPEQLPGTKAEKHTSSQILRSGTSPAGRYDN